MIRWKSLLDYLVEGHPSWEKRFAIFQTFQPHQYQHVNTIPLHIRLAFPQELIDILKEEYGEKETIRLAQVSNGSAPITIRVNPLKIDRPTLLKKWEKEYDVYPGEFSPLAIHFSKRAPLTALREFKEGLFEIQDETSQCVADLIDAKPGEHILDYCAGAGGKTLGFAHKTEGKGQIYLHDIRPIILERAKKRLKRAGIQNAQIILDPKKINTLMDWILVDVPCTGSGTYRRNPDQKWKFSKKQLDAVLVEQREIFEKAFSLLKDGGKIVYATCSLLKKENEEQIAFFLEQYPVRLTKTFKPVYSESGSDGFFSSVFEKHST